ncbi:MAG: hypothetical protein PHS04_12930 [Tissierellia bacterium]|nr:hypothetical protein [Tissierellia bacterium]
MNQSFLIEKDLNMVRDQVLAGDLEAKFKNLQIARLNLAIECLDIDAAIDELLRKRKEIEEKYNIKELEEEIKAEVFERGTSFKCSSGTAIYRSGSKLVKWDDAALLGYAAAGHSEIEQFRQEATGKSSIILKVNE